MARKYHVGQRLRLPHRDHEQSVDAVREAMIVGSSEPRGHRPRWHRIHVYLPGGLYVERHHDSRELSVLLRLAAAIESRLARTSRTLGGGQ